MSIEFSSFISQLFANPSLFIITALLINYYVILYTKKKIISLDDVKKHPKQYLAQKKFISKPLIGDDGESYHVCLGSYTVEGKVGKVTVDIEPIEGKGQVKVDGETWSAKSADEAYIPKDTEIIVEKIEGDYFNIVGLPVAEDFKNFEVLSISAPENRNMALFPEKINGYYTRLERPMPVDGRAWLTPGFDVWMSQSPDLKFWGNSDLVLKREEVPFSNTKIGPAAPPVKTDAGWLTLFHAVEHAPGIGKNGWEDKWE